MRTITSKRTNSTILDGIGVRYASFSVIWRCPSIIKLKSLWSIKANTTWCATRNVIICARILTIRTSGADVRIARTAWLPDIPRYSGGTERISFWSWTNDVPITPSVVHSSVDPNAKITRVILRGSIGTTPIVLTGNWSILILDTDTYKFCRIIVVAWEHTSWCGRCRAVFPASVRRMWACTPCIARKTCL